MHPNQYGSLNGGITHGHAQIEVQDQQRQVAALQKILAQTSDHLIDVFALHPSTMDSTLPSSAAPASDTRQSRYQDVLRQALAPDTVFEPGSVTSELNYRDETMARSSSAKDRDADDLISGLRTVNRDQVGQLVAGFAGPQTEGRSSGRRG